MSVWVWEVLVCGVLVSWFQADFRMRETLLTVLFCFFLLQVTMPGVVVELNKGGMRVNVLGRVKVVVEIVVAVDQLLQFCGEFAPGYGRIELGWRRCIGLFRT